MRRSIETDEQNRERAIQLLEQAKAKDLRRKLVPLPLGDEDKTILMVSHKLNTKQREKLKTQRLAILNKKRIVAIQAEI